MDLPLALLTATHPNGRNEVSLIYFTPSNWVISTVPSGNLAVIFSSPPHGFDEIDLKTVVRDDTLPRPYLGHFHPVQNQQEAR